jgi:hypothetical protein
MTGALVRSESAVAWELRMAWGSGRRVALSLERADMRRLEGHVQAVAATGAFVRVTGRVVPMDRVLAVHWPSLLGDSTARGVLRGPPRVPTVAEGQMEFPLR